MLIRRKKFLRLAHLNNEDAVAADQLLYITIISKAGERANRYAALEDASTRHDGNTDKSSLELKYPAHAQSLCQQEARNKPVTKLAIGAESHERLDRTVEKD